MRVLNLIREYEMQRMKESETIKEYSDRLLSIVNQVRLLSKDFSDSRIVQKILVTIPERFESMISSLENSKDMSSITLAELLNALQAQEQRRLMRLEGTVEGALAVKLHISHNNKGKKRNGKKSTVDQAYSKGEGSDKQYYPSCQHCGKKGHPPHKSLLVENIASLEDQNRKFLEQVESKKATVEMLKSELEKTKTEVEQEKMRCANTKEKLSMVVSKGKRLIQQRDSLKEFLADKTSEFEKCVAELYEKFSALEAAKLHNMDIVGKARWLVNERNELKRVSMDYYRLKDAFSTIGLPENVIFSDLDSRLAWLKESFYQAKDDINMLQTEISRTKEATRDEIDHLAASLSIVQ
ncbi:adenylate isopentenyltransferase 5 [Hibiscus syriacus]|uniref:Adenylate isopentenyltransferase 5 n=1 Tax=Hibiscus syriacus TaxID=106335 RepID=A0A6A2WV75_HIBSY|nr:adenylate isopentenyltransferase 5 [Hibiscus syriacus]